jgi:hypothetical protein
MVVHCPQGGGARGGDQQPFLCSLDFYGGDQAVHRPISGGVHHPFRCQPQLQLFFATSRWALPYQWWCHQTQWRCPLGQLAALGLPADHRHRGGGAPDKGWRCPRGNTPSPTTSPFLHLFHHLCKCANTPSVLPSRASVLAFSQSFFKG